MPYKDPEARRQFMRQYAEQNREALLSYKKAYYQANKERLSKPLPEEKKEARRIYSREWYQRNKQAVAKYSMERKDHRNARQRERRRADPLFALRCRVVRRLANALARSGFSKSATTAQMLGCDWETLRRHIELQFLPGMNWDNRDKWHVDHIVPLSSAKNEEDVLALSHYTNLRPLWAEQNLKKQAKLENLI